MKKTNLSVSSIEKITDCTSNFSYRNKEHNKDNQQPKDKQEILYKDLKRVVKKHAKENNTNLMELNFAVFLVKDGFTIKEAAVIAELEIQEVSDYIYKTLKRENRDEYNYIMDLLREREFEKVKRK